MVAASAPGEAGQALRHLLISMVPQESLQVSVHSLWLSNQKHKIMMRQRVILIPPIVPAVVITAKQRAFVQKKKHHRHCLFMRTILAPIFADIEKKYAFV